MRRAVLAVLAGSNAVALGLLPRENALHPRRKEAAGETPRPRLLLVLVRGNNATSRSLLDDKDKGVDEDIRADTGNESVCNRVGEGHNGDGEERGNGISHILPIDVLGRLCHKRSDNDKRASCGPRRNRCEYRGEEDGDEETESSEHSSETGLATLGDTSTRLDVRSDR